MVQYPYRNHHNILHKITAKKNYVHPVAVMSCDIIIFLNSMVYCRSANVINGFFKLGANVR